VGLNRTCGPNQNSLHSCQATTGSFSCVLIPTLK
jgi:hypothetical protein